MIGIFDSGSGGLTVLRAIRARFPSIDVIYYGDIKNAPYGSRSREELSRLTVQALRLLHERGARSIVSACNSVSASLAVSLFDTHAIEPHQLIEMVGPTVRSFRGFQKRIALCATPATIQSGIYQSAFEMIGQPVRYVAIPDLAGAIEFGRTADVEPIIRQAFPESERDFDVLILACTHYPLVIDTFKRVLGDITIFDPAYAVAERVEDQFWPREVGDGATHFIITKESEQFRGFVKDLFPHASYEVEVVE